MVKLVQFFEATNDNTLSGGAGILVFVPSTGHILVQVRGEHPDDKDSGKYDFFGGTLEEGETSEECARREAKEEGGLEFPEGGIEEIGAFSSTEGGDWDGEPYHVFLRVEDKEFPVKVDKDEVAKAAWVGPNAINPKTATSRLIKATEHLSTNQLNESTPRTLYHGTSIPRAKKILQQGLEPKVGDLVNQFYNDTEAYGDVDLEPLVFAADKKGLDGALSAMSAAIAKDYGEDPESVEDLAQRGAILVLRQAEDDFYYRPDDEDEGAQNDYTEYPIQVEPGDYYSPEGVLVDYVLTGKKLRTFLKNKLGSNASIGFSFDGEQKYKREFLVKLLVKKHPGEPVQRIIDFVKGVSQRDIGRMIFSLEREFEKLNESVKGNRSNLPDEVAYAFVALGDAQRGTPEQIMVKLQHLMGGGILNPVIEHVGDLTHRMSHMATWGEEYGMGQEYVVDKADKTYQWLTNPYGFEKEMEENIRSNASHRGVDPEKLKKKIFGGLEVYARAHEQLPVYNKMQWMARQAAIDVGRRDWKSAAQWLQFLKRYASKSREEWVALASEYKLAPDGKTLIKYQ